MIDGQSTIVVQLSSGFNRAIARSPCLVYLLIRLGNSQSFYLLKKTVHNLTISITFFYSNIQISITKNMNQARNYEKLGDT